MKAPHLPIMASEILRAFSSRVISTFVDGTLGAGGHAKALLEAHSEIQRFIGFDQDPDALDIAKQTLIPWKHKTLFFHDNFKAITSRLHSLEVQHVEGILMDLGVSSMQFDRPEKGFSFMGEGPLDMRMNPENPLTAADIVNEWSQKELERIFRDYGEEKKWRAAAHAIVEARQHQKIETTQQLAAILDPVLKKGPPFSGKKKINPLTLVFQALRISVNEELDVLEKTLPKAIELLAPGGILAVITFHSLEDRIVKHFFRYAASDKEETSGLGGGLFLNKDPLVRFINKKPLIAEESEIRENPRARSAKLRMVEKI